MFLYSRSTNGFYLPGLSTNVPDDAVEITAERHRQLMEAQADGRRILADARGRPIADRRTRPAAGQLRARLRTAIQREASRRIRAVSPEWRQMNDLREPSAAGAMRFARIDAIRAASNAIEELAAGVPAGDLAAFPVATHPLWPEID